MHISMNGPAVSTTEGSKAIDRAVKQSLVRRGKLLNVQRSTRMHASSMTTSDVLLMYFNLHKVTGVFQIYVIYIFVSQSFQTSYLQVQTAEQDEVCSSDDKAEGPPVYREELAETAVPEDTPRSLNLCPDDNSNVDSESDCASNFAQHIFQTKE